MADRINSFDGDCLLVGKVKSGFHASTSAIYIPDLLSPYFSHVNFSASWNVSNSTRENSGGAMLKKSQTPAAEYRVLSPVIREMQTMCFIQSIYHIIIGRARFILLFLRPCKNPLTIGEDNSRAPLIEGGGKFPFDYFSHGIVPIVALEKISVWLGGIGENHNKNIIYLFRPVND